MNLPQEADAHDAPVRQRVLPVAAALRGREGGSGQKGQGLRWPHR